jgi:hypothetical protein
MPEGIDRRGALVGQNDQRAIDRGQEMRAVAASRALDEGHVRIAEHPADGRRRRLPGDDPVHHRSEGVHVGPRTLLQARHFGVLLDGRVAGLEDGRQRLRHVANDPARGTEVEQQRPVVGRQQHDVVGRDVAVEALRRMQHPQRMKERLEQGQDPRLVGRLGEAAHRVAHGHAFVERHDHVRRAVRFPEAVDLDQRRVVELGEQLGFVDEALHPRSNVS